MTHRSEAWLAGYEEGSPLKKQRAKPIQREHISQRHGRLWVRDCVAVPHKFLAFDRTKAGGKFSHLRERGRGITKATPDTQLTINGLPSIWCEWKAPGEKPTEDQFRMGRELQALGQVWFWTRSVRGYMQGLVRFGVPLRPNAAVMAALHDAEAAATIARAEIKRGELPKRPRGTALRDAALAPEGDVQRFLDGEW